jgi:hypothetical protein
MLSLRLNWPRWSPRTLLSSLLHLGLEIGVSELILVTVKDVDEGLCRQQEEVMLFLDAEFEAELAEMEPEDAAEFLADAGIEEPGLDKGRCRPCESSMRGTPSPPQLGRSVDQECRSPPARACLDRVPR